MIIEYIKDCRDERPGRRKQIKKGKRLKVTREFGEQEVKAKRAKDISHKEDEFLKATQEKNSE